MQSAPCSAVLVCQLSRLTEQGKPVPARSRCLLLGSRALQLAPASVLQHCVISTVDYSRSLKQPTQRQCNARVTTDASPSSLNCAALL